MLIVGRGKRELTGRFRQLALFVGVIPVLVLGVVLSIWASYGFRYAMLNPTLGPADAVIPWDDVSTRSMRSIIWLALARTSFAARGLLVRLLARDALFRSRTGVSEWRVSGASAGSVFSRTALPTKRRWRYSCCWHFRRVPRGDTEIAGSMSLQHGHQ